MGSGETQRQKGNRQRWWMTKETASSRHNGTDVQTHRWCQEAQDPNRNQNRCLMNVCHGEKNILLNKASTRKEDIATLSPTE